MVYVVVVTEILVAVVHVRAGIDIEILTLAVGDGESVSLSGIRVLAEEGRDQGTVGLTISILEDLVVEEADSQEGEDFPARSHLFEVTNTRNSLKAQPETTSPGEATIAVETLVKVVKALSVLNRDIV